MREIKFDLIYKGEIGFHHKKYHLCELMKGIDKICDIHNLMELVVKRQYIGRKDKNGKEIYEGDLISGMNYCIAGKAMSVVFDKKTAQFVLEDEDGLIYWLHNELENIEVIGNIYENPELLNLDQPA